MTLSAAKNAAHLQRAVFRMRFVSHGFQSPFRCRQIADGTCLIVDANVCVPHHHVDITVPSKFLGINQGGAIAKQFGNVRMSTSGMKIGYSVFGLIRDADAFQVLADHEPGLATLQIGKQQLSRLDILEPLRELHYEFWVEWEHILAAVLRTSRLDRHSRR
jgi:hypothetical protein